MKVSMVTNQKGMTLIEVIITLSIASIIMAYGIPNMRDFYLKQTLNEQANSILADISFSRGESINKGLSIRISGIDGDFENGWEIVSDSNRNGAVDGSDEILRKTKFTNSNLSLVDSEPGNPIYFSPTGALHSGFSRVFQVKHNDIPTIKNITISLSGSTSVN